MTRKGVSRRGLLAMATGGAASMALAGGSLSAGAADGEGYAPPTLMTMGTVGVTPAETVRLSIVMYADPDAGWMLCDGFLSFNNLAGEQVATSKFHLSAGQGAYLDWTPRGKLARSQVYPMVTVTSDMTQPGYSTVVMGATVEIFDRLTLLNRASVVGVLRCTGA